MQNKKSQFINDRASKKQWPIVIGILFIAILIAYLLTEFKPVAEKKALKNALPIAEYIVANSQLTAVPVISQGSIKAKTNIKLIAEVSGRIIQIANLKFAGGFFKKGDLLLSIDDTDYRLGMRRAQAQVAAAKQRLVKAQTEATQAKYDLQQIGRDPSKSNAYALRKPQLAEAQASLQAAQADLELSRLQMQRTRVIAPFDGRVVSKQVDIGQYVSVGTLLADIYSIESVKVRLPLSLQQTELLGIKLRDNDKQLDVLNIKLFSDYASKKFQWDANFSHTEGEIDVRNRLVYLVAEVGEPYKKNPQFINRPPLTPGMFVKAQLSGVQKKLFKLPRSVLRSNQYVWLIDKENKLQIITVNVITKDRDFIYINSIQTENNLTQRYLIVGDKVISNTINYPLNGMLLSPVLFNSVANKNTNE